MSHTPGFGRPDAERAVAAARSVGPHGPAWEKWAKAWETGAAVPDALFALAGLEAWTTGRPKGLAAGFAVWAARAEWVPHLARDDADQAAAYAAADLARTTTADLFGAET